MNPPTHAQNRRLRRLANRLNPENNQRGLPIPGPLTPTEIAHKARRKARRAINLTERKRLLEQSIISLLSVIKQMTEVINNPQTKEKDRNTARNTIQQHEITIRQQEAEMVKINTSLIRI